MKDLVELNCDGYYIGPELFQYVVTDKNDIVVAEGISSDEISAKNDAGGYHTKKEFDEKFGEDNWKVNFNF